jgi:hypothetical protein
MLAQVSATHPIFNLCLPKSPCEFQAELAQDRSKGKLAPQSPVSQLFDSYQEIFFSLIFVLPSLSHDHTALSTQFQTNSLIRGKTRTKPSRSGNVHKQELLFTGVALLGTIRFELPISEKIQIKPG